MQNNPNVPYWFGCIPDCQMTPDKKCIQCNIDLGHLGTGPNSLTDGAKTIREAIQNAFDQGFKAAGGTMIPDGARDMVELALDRKTLSAIADIVEYACHPLSSFQGPCFEQDQALLMKFLETISIIGQGNEQPRA